MGHRHLTFNLSRIKLKRSFVELLTHSNLLGDIEEGILDRPSSKERVAVCKIDLVDLHSFDLEHDGLALESILRRFHHSLDVRILEEECSFIGFLNDRVILKPKVIQRFGVLQTFPEDEGHLCQRSNRSQAKRAGFSIHG